MGPLGMQEMIAIFVLALLLFGPKKLPELGRLLGKGLSEFRRAKNELKTTFESHLHELEKETKSLTQPTTTTDYSLAPPYQYDEQGRYDSVSSEPSTAGVTAPQDAEAHRDYSSSQNLPAAGTVPRSNGIHSAGQVSADTEEYRPVS